MPGYEQHKNFKHEIVFGIVCPLGTDYEPVIETLENYVRRFGYSAKVQRLSREFDKLLEALREDPSTLREGRSELEAKILAGDTVRRLTTDNGILAKYAARCIAEGRNVGTEQQPPPQPGTCQIIVQLKRPEEVDVLRATYGFGFYLIGIFSGHGDRMEFFRRAGIEESSALNLIATDSEEKEEYGQRTTKTFQLADVFISSREFEQQVPRFLDLVFGCPFITPTRDERGMFMAFASALSSGDLSRQVGASIVDTEGDLLGVGYNEVPKFGGGPYPGGWGSHRDIERGEDANHVERRAIADKIYSALSDWGISRAVAERAFTVAGLFDITEYGRAVHAEMDAILSCARTSRSPKGCTLYATTFPCHNCTRHIVASGISRVVYVEPYPKSKAGQLHDDAIDLYESAQGSDCSGRVPFVPFIGVGPRRYMDLFSLKLGSGIPLDREINGKKREWKRPEAEPRLRMTPSSYLEREEMASKSFEERIVAKRREDDNERGA